MEFEESKIDTHIKNNVFTVPINGMYAITNTLCYVNHLKMNLYVNRAKMKGIKLTNKNHKRLRIACQEVYTSYESMRVAKDGVIVNEMKIPEKVIKKMKHQSVKNNSCNIRRIK